MGKSVFISYSHQQSEWVWKNLVPCLKAGGAEVHIDLERFRAGKEVVMQQENVVLAKNEKTNSPIIKIGNQK